ncbi:uncharacterized protein B0P05DRAFT_547499 [Gilbertella persicaria]|uniref:uncharacterized protein n=1 Tax=Gilbertella persicaria TaxID=101096 RepID=UPI00221EB0AA|nr:uncharacterized protein B0P05DRAFT_547499 [Gilbertella persicaria]KAI8075436.1 hypothetical protein B0P05DRAFT_547499 [Gilbertella persicaria]
MRSSLFLIITAVLAATVYASPLPQDDSKTFSHRRISANPDDLLSHQNFNEFNIDKHFVRGNKEESAFIKIEEGNEGLLNEAFTKEN